MSLLPLYRTIDINRKESKGLKDLWCTRIIMYVSGVAFIIKITMMVVLLLVGLLLEQIYLVIHILS